MTTTARVPRDLDEYLEANDRRIRDELDAFLRIPSVSARSEHKGDVAKAADWLAASLESAGMSVEVHQTPGHPIVLAEWPLYVQQSVDSLVNE